MPNVALVAADKVTLSFGDDQQLSVTIDKGTIDGLVDNKQLIQAQGGNVLLRVEAINDLFSASVNNSGVIQAQSIGEKNGSIVLLADMETGTTTVDGTLDASATSAGQGGFIETSAAQVDVKGTAQVTASGNGGDNGLWLIDPSDLVIDSTNVDAYNTSLNNGTNVSLNTFNAAQSDDGDIFVNADISWTTDNTRLTLQAERNIEINAEITASGANSGVQLDTKLSYNSGVSWNKTFTNEEYANTNYISYGNGGKITLTGADALYIQDGITHEVINGNNSTLTGSTALAELQNIDLSLRYALGTDLVAGNFNAIIAGLIQFDGLNNEISNLTIAETANTPTGLFAEANSTDQSYLRNLHIASGSITGSTITEDVGAFLGIGENISINNLTNAATVSGDVRVGGIVGSLNTDSLFVNSHNSGDINGDAAIGGLIGRFDSSLVSLSSNSGDVTGINNNVGGLIGKHEGENNSIVQYSHNSGNVSARQSVGGLIGRIDGNNNNRSIIKESYSIADTISATQNRVGGITGFSERANFFNVYALSDITGETQVGGLIGRSTQSNISTSFFSGDVTATGISPVLGGVVGRIDRFSLNNVVYHTTSNLNYFGERTNLFNSDTTKIQNANISNLRSAATYSAFNLGNCGSTATWCIIDGESLPALNNARTTLYLDVTSAEKLYDQANTDITFTHNSADIVNNKLILNTTDLLLDASDSNAGTYDVNQLTLQGFDSVQFNVVLDADTTATITPFALDVSVDVDNKVYDGTTSVINYTPEISGVFAGDDVSFDALSSISFADNNAGGNKNVNTTGLVLTGSDLSNYTYNTTTISQADITQATLTTTIDVEDKVYDGTANVIDYDASFTGLVSGDDVSVGTIGSLLFDDKNAGTNKQVNATGIVLSGLDANNYSYNTTANSTADITKATLTAAIDVEDKVYDGTAQVTDYEVLFTGLISGDDVSVGSFGSLLFDDKKTGTNKQVNATGIVLSGLDANNYSYNTTANTTANITKAALTIALDVQDKEYDGTANVTDYEAAFTGLISGDEVTVDSIGDISFDDENIGISKPVNATGIVLFGQDADNYTYNTVVNTTADITLATLIVSLSGVDKVYDGTTVATDYDVSLSGVVSGEDVSIDSIASVAFADENAGANKEVNVNGILLSGADLSNYSYENDAVLTGNISKANLTTSINAESKVYDGSVNVKDYTSTVSGLIGDDVVAVGSIGSVLFEDKNVGDNKLVNASNIVLVGADVNNYSYNSVAVGTADITQAQLTANFDIPDKIYDGTTDISEYESSFIGLFEGDDVAFESISNLHFNDKNVGTNKEVSATGLILTGKDANNYSYDSTINTTADIIPAPLDVTFSVADKVYDATTTVNDYSVALTGLVLDEDVTIDSIDSVFFSDENVGTNKPVNITGFKLSGSDVKNYSYSTDLQTSADISKSLLNVNVNDVEKLANGLVYEGINTVNIDGFFGSDSINDLTGELTFSGDALEAFLPGEYLIEVSGLSAQNYRINYTPGKLTISDVVKSQEDINLNASVCKNPINCINAESDLIPKYLQDKENEQQEQQSKKKYEETESFEVPNMPSEVRIINGGIRIL